VSNNQQYQIMYVHLIYNDSSNKLGVELTTLMVLVNWA